MKKLKMLIHKFFFNGRNFPLRGKEYKISVIFVNENLESFTEKIKLETIIQELSSKSFKRTEFIFKTIMKHFSDKDEIISRSMTL